MKTTIKIGKIINFEDDGEVLNTSLVEVRTTAMQQFTYVGRMQQHTYGGENILMVVAHHS